MSEKQFDDLGDDYYSIKGGHVHLYYTEQKVNILKDYTDKDSRCLDVGCGVGLHSKMLREKKNCRVYGMDLSKSMVKSASKNLDGSFVLLGSATKIPYRDSSFDVVYTVNVLHHLIDHVTISKAIEEMVRVSKRYIIIFEFNSKNPFCRYLLFKICPYDSGNERIPSRGEVINIANENGLCIKEVMYKSFMPMFCPAPLMPFFTKLEVVLEKVIPWMSVGMVYILEKKECQNNNSN
jgi:ubiquinone/menaquinone biosynthesis C-methylase UbiE